MDNNEILLKTVEKENKLIIEKTYLTLVKIHIYYS